MVKTLPWNLPLPRLLPELGATSDGLSGEEVELRLAKYGPNDALAHRRRPLWRQLLDRQAYLCRLCALRRAMLPTPCARWPRRAST
jgi:cation transport ATPase-like protein